MQERENCVKSLAVPYLLPCPVPLRRAVRPYVIHRAVERLSNPHRNMCPKVPSHRSRRKRPSCSSRPSKGVWDLWVSCKAKRGSRRESVGRGVFWNHATAALTISFVGGSSFVLLRGNCGRDVRCCRRSAIPCACLQVGRAESVDEGSQGNDWSPGRLLQSTFLADAHGGIGGILIWIIMT